MSQVRYTAEFKADMAARYRASANKMQFAREVGVSQPSLWEWARGGKPRPGELRVGSGRHRPSGRVHEFRMMGEELQTLSAAGEWETYVPFRDVREKLERLTRWAADVSRLRSERIEDLARRQLLRNEAQREWRRERYEERLERLAMQPDFEPAERAEPRCVHCRERGHQVRTCPQARAQPTAGEP